MKAINQTFSLPAISLDRDEKRAAALFVNVVSWVALYFFAQTGALQELVITLSTCFAMIAYVVSEMNTVAKIKEKLSSHPFRMVAGVNLFMLFLLTF